KNRSAFCRAVFLRSPKAPQSFAAGAAKESEIIFSGDMCGGENTAQAASVEFACRRHTNYARSRLQAFCRKTRRFSDRLKNRSAVGRAVFDFTIC
ncbi:MAG: hypothetical protein KBH16_04020, partial [Oscillospiraceae bacterium]|nr:hypothetical protein [Oscillospiraceae bacterium]